MKKDRAWLKEALFALRMTGKPEYHRTERERELGRVQQWAWNSCIDRAYELAEELDEPQTNCQIDKLANFIMSEVEGEPSQSEGAVDTAIRIIKSYQSQETLSQEWVDEHAEYYEYLGYEVVPVNDLQSLFMPEQKELEIKIQELIEKYGKEDGKHSNWENGWIDEFLTDLENLTGKKEKVPKYYVDLDAAAYVARWVRDGSVQIYTDSISGNNEYELHLTEQEIKDYDPRFWLFAVAVEEVEQ